MFSSIKKLFLRRGTTTTAADIPPATAYDGTAAFALAEKGDAMAIPGLIHGMVMARPPDDRPFTSALRKFGAEAVPHLIEALAREPYSTNWRKSTIVDLLGDIADPTAVPVLINTINDSDDFVRMRTAGALGKIKDPSSVPALVQRLLKQDPKDWRVNRSIIKALGEIGGADAILGLATFLASDSYVDGSGLRLHTVEALRALGQEVPQKPEMPKLIPDIEQLKVEQLISLLREVAKATMGSAPSHLDSYYKRRGTAREIGEELYRRGGKSLMKRIIDEGVGPVPGQRTIDQFWDGIGEWRG